MDPFTPFLPTSPEPYAPLTEALHELSINPHVHGLEFLTARVLSGTLNYYDPAFIDAAAAADVVTIEDLKLKLKKLTPEGYSVRSFSTRIAAAKARLTTQEPSKLIISDRGAPKPILANAITHLKSSPLKLAFDQFSSVVIHQTKSPWGSEGRWCDLDDISAANYLQHAGVTVGSATAAEAALFIAHANAIHPVRDWLVALKWDGTPRLMHLANYYFNCEGVLEFMRGVSERWAISAVARIMRPGCLAKYMIVMEGVQDEGKSRGLRALVNGHLDGDTGRQWFRDNMPDIDKDDIGLYMQGVWIIEVAELSAIRGKEWERTKSFISSPRDSFRKKFGRHMQDYPRQCVFAGTTNQDQWGGDQTGLTRFWPLRAGKPRIDDILRDYDQIWAEARTLFDENRPWWGDPDFDKLAREEQSQRAPEDNLSDRVSQACHTMIQSDVSVSEMLDILQIQGTRERKAEAPAIGRALINLGWERYRVREGDGQLRRYRLK